ncbi:MAG: hypothetical protein ACRDGU_01830 [Actinomycetota bacterium]
MLATLTDRHFSDPGWIFERKLDGERCLAFRLGNAVPDRARRTGVARLLLLRDGQLRHPRFLGSQGRQAASGRGQGAARLAALGFRW